MSTRGFYIMEILLHIHNVQQTEVISFLLLTNYESI